MKASNPSIERTVTRMAMAGLKNDGNERTCNIRLRLLSPAAHVKR